MKTGSTVIQEILFESRQLLNARGIAYWHLPAKDLLDNLTLRIENGFSSNMPIVILSSEFIGQQDPLMLRDILRCCGFECHAIFVYRPLRELYPSLYLQNLKGSSRRVTSFSTFLANQIRNDSDPSLKLAGQLMNFQELNNRLEVAGCQTHFIAYSKNELLKSLKITLGVISGKSFQFLPDSPSSPARSLSPRRSLRMELAPIAVYINKLNRLRCLSDSFRRHLLTALIQLSQLLDALIPKGRCIDIKYIEACEDVDRLVNHPFLRQRGFF